MSFSSRLCEAGVKLCLLLLLASCSHVFYQPIKGALFAPELVGLSAEEVTLETSDGVGLLAWAFRTERAAPLGTVLQFHGNGENMSTHFLALSWLLKEGYDVLVFDYRGYGFSGGEPTAQGTYLDGLAALAWAQADAQKRGSALFVVYGQSLGGQIAARSVADYEAQARIDLLVQDSTFGSYQQIAADKILDHLFLWPFLPLAYLAVSDEWASAKVYARVRTPVLGIHAVKDPVVPFSLGEKNFAGLPNRVSFWKLKKGQHGDVFHHAGGRYRAQFLELLARLRQEKSSH